MGNKTCTRQHMEGGVLRMRGLLEGFKACSPDPLISAGTANQASSLPTSAVSDIALTTCKRCCWSTGSDRFRRTNTVAAGEAVIATFPCGHSCTLDASTAACKHEILQLHGMPNCTTYSNVLPKDCKVLGILQDR